MLPRRTAKMTSALQQTAYSTIHLVSADDAVSQAYFLSKHLECNPNLTCLERPDLHVLKDDQRGKMETSTFTIDLNHASG